jgi:hypothetical protein
MITTLALALAAAMMYTANSQPSSSHPTGKPADVGNSKPAEVDGTKASEMESTKDVTDEATDRSKPAIDSSKAASEGDKSGEEAAETGKGKTPDAAFKPEDVKPSVGCTYGAPSQPKEETFNSRRKRALQVGPLDILCGKTAKCGEATITVGNDNVVSVTVTKTADWNINHVHIFAGPGWPTEWATKAPPPGQFPFQTATNADFTSLTHTFKIGEGVLAHVCGAPLATGGQLAIAIHTESTPSAGGSSETGWAKGNNAFGGARWGWFQSLCVPCGDNSDGPPAVDISDVALEAAAAVQDPVVGATEKKVNAFKAKKAEKEKKEKEEKSEKSDDDASEKEEKEEKVKVLKVKLNSKTVSTNNGADVAVRVIQAAFDRHADKFAAKGVTATVSKSADGHISVTLTRKDGGAVTGADEEQAANVVAAFAIVEEVQPADAVLDAAPVAGSASMATLALTASLAAISAVMTF